jgi:hypothetical protein
MFAEVRNSVYMLWRMDWVFQDVIPLAKYVPIELSYIHEWNLQVEEVMIHRLGFDVYGGTAGVQAGGPLGQLTGHQSIPRRTTERDNIHNEHLYRKSTDN